MALSALSVWPKFLQQIRRLQTEASDVEHSALHSGYDCTCVSATPLRVCSIFIMVQFIPLLHYSFASEA